ncbi:hypothetical protein K493DRAFT_302756 [Basidiobolus meristosporus CBS 931.73]|uniref:Uncharacterized protein n=1 Tax=Basidiobolus meristosporus CBS 931.73 TaxID=1314790 RepID=A0A1Y1Y5J6_9FUNG|nr:hypothetical protein K493DRAFT_302756 [Basidiobolus meristosporus CBS 931.73]|eukprot:ORX93287.1 hypothetical protein K493DRAFT_302756 [Basidiobolus meristosporus CBS 931.73]
MQRLSILAFVALATHTCSAPVGSPSQCEGWSVGSLAHATGPGSTFSPNDHVVITWTATDSSVTNIREVDLFSAKDDQFLHTQYRSYPGVSATAGQLSLTLTVPLCLQRDGDYYLKVYSSASGQDMDCSLQTGSFQITPDPNGDFSQCT